MLGEMTTIKMLMMTMVMTMLDEMTTCPRRGWAMAPRFGPMRSTDRDH